MSRYHTRKAARQAANIVTKAKKDMIAWVETLDHSPTTEEMIAWQAGYVSGVSRLEITKEDND